MEMAAGPSNEDLPVLKPDELGVEIRFSADQMMDNNPEYGERMKKVKLGHRRIDKQGEISYKRVPTNALMGAIQLGIANSIGSLASKAKRDILVQDFEVIDSVPFPSDGSQITPSHTYGDFRFKTYAPIAFRYFRELFNIKPADFLKSLCTQQLRELSNPGASGSIFYVSTDDKFIIKTVQHKEAEFLRKLLPGYYMNLHQNPRTLLPKFFGLFCYQSLGKNIRLLVMNNLLPQSIKMHYKFDLKGSTYKRFASHRERDKENPTLKDLDFNQEFTNGILLETHVYEILMDVIKRDCLVLESFKIMDYSLLMGVHNIDECAPKGNDLAVKDQTMDNNPSTDLQPSTETWKSLQLDFSSKNKPHDEGGVPARNTKGERLLIYLGIIDILQSYRLLKKLEHTWKSVLHDGDSISVTNPGFYAARFQTYISNTVFRRASADNVQQVRHPCSKFRSFVHSFIAMKQTPMLRAQQRSRTSEGYQADEQQHIGTARQRVVERMEPHAHEDALDSVVQHQQTPVGVGLLSQRGTSERRSYYAKTAVSNLGVLSSEFEKKKRVDRLFATASANNTEDLPPAHTQV